MKHTDTLTTLAHDKCLDQGQHISADTMADLVQHIEGDTGHEFTPAEIRKAYVDAGEMWVDSEIENLIATYEAGGLSEAETIERKNALEAQRPLALRRKFILSVLA